ncbi:hypothetical protein Scep_027313 [Stephania cephalantha]|uniref:Uncharacterized protein n=1 Tax=Stephania cephalantha TaxID=152367 RepID=A0AAP0HKZ1_9MAGN
MKFIQISSMPVDENITLKRNFKLKVKLPQPKSQVENITVKKKLKLIKVKLPRARSQLDKSIEFEHERPISGSCKNGSSVKCTGKRGAETRLCGHKLKKLKIGSGAMQQALNSIECLLENGSLLKQNGVRRKNRFGLQGSGSNGIIKQKIATEGFCTRHLRILGLLCENKDDGETASEIQIVTTSSCFNSNVIGKFCTQFYNYANTTGATCGQDSSLKHPKNNNTNPKCESATSKRLGNPAATYPKGSFGDMKSHCGHDNAFSEASSGLSLFSTTIE